MDDDKNYSVEKIAPQPTIRRIPSYLRILYEYQAEGNQWISATDIAERLSLKPIQVRKDMSFTGITGKPKKGFLIQDLITSIRNFLGWTKASDAVIIGTGALGSALLGYKSFSTQGLNIVAAFDKDPARVGQTIRGMKVRSMEELPGLVSQLNVRIGIITVPSESAQEVADILVSAGIEGIWNFSPMKINTPPTVVVQKEDLCSGLAVLSVKMGARHSNGDDGKAL